RALSACRTAMGLLTANPGVRSARARAGSCRRRSRRLLFGRRINPRPAPPEKRSERKPRRERSLDAFVHEVPVQVSTACRPHEDRIKTNQPRGSSFGIRAPYQPIESASGRDLEQVAGGEQSQGYVTCRL